ncbi:hypothetical protein PPERSA_07603 [Pseudocohnilembus persalinus]|uniref:Uncharacterized protein n=1 Tax=Pseudocohnilembus persalinus TaxID=266149 RepID=A0A0V0QIC5_PSEPJ|nr:hypothetical protein PPERSA_07603 [Pseudocohnilembus persalinus]|eukprot:KRX01958.1 hypothetical protein PPERSA_07603 [Pseudocohnilembus persalinus]
MNLLPNLPNQIKEMLIQYAANIKLTGKRFIELQKTTAANKKVKTKKVKIDYFQNAHYLLCFLQINPKSIKKISNNDRVIQLHKHIFDIDFQSDNIDHQKLNHVNIIKEIFFQIVNNCSKCYQDSDNQQQKYSQQQQQQQSQNTNSNSNTDINLNLDESQQKQAKVEENAQQSVNQQELLASILEGEKKQTQNQNQLQNSGVEDHLEGSINAQTIQQDFLNNQSSKISNENGSSQQDLNNQNSNNNINNNRKIKLLLLSQQQQNGEEDEINDENQQQQTVRQYAQTLLSRIKQMNQGEIILRFSQ